MLAHCRRPPRRAPLLECLATELDATFPRVACLPSLAICVEKEWLDLILLDVQPLLFLASFQATLLVAVLE